MAPVLNRRFCPAPRQVAMESDECDAGRRRGSDVVAHDGRTCSGGRSSKPCCWAHARSTWSTIWTRANFGPRCAAAPPARSSGPTSRSVTAARPCSSRSTPRVYRAAARMGAGILEQDVTFTQDEQLVCRHSQCDLHTTTNILAVPELAAKCRQPFTPADPQLGTRFGHVLHERHHARRVQDARGVDGRRQSRRDHGGGIPEWDGTLADRPAFSGKAFEPRREHRAVRQPW